MRFYVVGSNTPIYKGDLDAANGTDIYDLAKQRFDDCVSEVKYSDIYLIADFETQKHGLFEYVRIDEELTSDLPYLVIGEYHFEESNLPTMRKDCLCIETKGIKEYIRNNESAIRKFLNFYEHKVNSNLYLTFATSRVGDIIYRKIAGTKEMILGERIPIKKILIETYKLNGLVCPFEEN